MLSKFELIEGNKTISSQKASQSLLKVPNKIKASNQNLSKDIKH